MFVSSHIQTGASKGRHSWWLCLFHLPKMQGFLKILHLIDQNINLVDNLDFCVLLIQCIHLTHGSATKSWSKLSAPLRLHGYCPSLVHQHLTQAVVPWSSTILSPSTLAPLKFTLHISARLTFRSLNLIMLLFAPLKSYNVSITLK